MNPISTFYLLPVYLFTMLVSEGLSKWDNEAHPTKHTFSGHVGKEEHDLSQYNQAPSLQMHFHQEGNRSLLGQ